MFVTNILPQFTNSRHEAATGSNLQEVSSTRSAPFLAATRTYEDALHLVETLLSEICVLILILQNHRW